MLHIYHLDPAGGLLCRKEDPEIIEQAAFFQHGGADADALLLRDDRADAAAELRVHLDQGASVPVQILPGRRQGDAPGGAEEELGPEVLFQRARI